jgi:hypothetical protein
MSRVLAGLGVLLGRKLGGCPDNHVVTEPAAGTGPQSLPLPIAYPDSCQVTTYRYDPDRMQPITDPSSRVTTCVYDRNGRFLGMKG